MTQSLTEQLDHEKRAVSYDVYDMTVRQLVDMVAANEIDVAPDYQRRFVWDDARESELVESIYLGIPVPSLYMAANRDGSWEVVDGVQRLSTLVHFCGAEEVRKKVGRSDPLVLKDLSKLSSFDGMSFESLPKSVRLGFTLRPVRVTTLNDKSDFAVRYDLFERLNTGGVKLHAQEIRNCVMRGAFRELLRNLASSESFRAVVRIPNNEQQEAIYEECVLRFFAYLERYETFEHSVVGFLNDYMIERALQGPTPASVASFIATFEWLRTRLPNGIVRGARNNTPLNLYEAVAVGAALALQQSPGLATDPFELMNSDAMRRLTTGATNSRRMVVDRIEFMRNGLLA